MVFYHFRPFPLAVFRLLGGWIGRVRVPVVSTHKCRATNVYGERGLLRTVSWGYGEGKLVVHRYTTGGL